MGKYRFVFFIVVLLLAGSCNNKQDNTSQQSTGSDIIKEEEAIKEVLTDMWDAIEKHDIDRYASHVHPEFTQFGETDSVLLVGKTAEVKSIEEYMGHSENVHTEMHEPKITINGNIAWIVYYWSDSGLNRNLPFTSRGKSTRIFKKENGKWLCIHGHYTLLP